VKPNINSVEVHPQLSNNRHPLDGAPVGAGSLWEMMVYGCGWGIKFGTILDAVDNTLF
jgi:hypothetical protein